jgi:hypothetical protein
VAGEAWVSSRELFEEDVTLRHFLSRSYEVGALNRAELALLLEFRLESDFADRKRAARSNALRQRMKRLLSKMRRRATYKVLKPAILPGTKNTDTILRISPE